MITLWDLDNCLADDAWRRGKIDRTAEDPYAAYHAACEDDRPGNLARFDRMRARGMHPVFVTGRPMAYFLETQRWLLRELGVALVPGQLLMRANGDRRPSPEMKCELVGTRVPLRLVHCAYDDREDVLAAYRRELAIPCLLLAINATTNTEEEMQP